MAKRRTQQRWPEASLARVEQDVMLAFYSIRKLIDAAKVATATADMALDMREYPWAGKGVTRMNWHKTDELYQLDSPQTVSRRLRWVCNQIVHSYVFSLVFSDSGGLDGLTFTSDHERHKQLSFLGIAEFIQLLEHVGSDYPSDVRMTLNRETGDYDVDAITHRG